MWLHVIRCYLTRSYFVGVETEVIHKRSYLHLQILLVVYLVVRFGFLLRTRYNFLAFYVSKNIAWLLLLSETSFVCEWGGWTHIYCFSFSFEYLIFYLKYIILFHIIVDVIHLQSFLNSHSSICIFGQVNGNGNPIINRVKI